MRPINLKKKGFSAHFFYLAQKSPIIDKRAVGVCVCVLRGLSLIRVLFFLIFSKHHIFSFNTQFRTFCR